jgi:hypothetical protein
LKSNFLCSSNGTERAESGGRLSAKTEGEGAEEGISHCRPIFSFSLPSTSLPESHPSDSAKTQQREQRKEIRLAAAIKKGVETVREEAERLRRELAGQQAASASSAAELHRKRQRLATLDSQIKLIEQKKQAELEAKKNALPTHAEYEASLTAPYVHTQGLRTGER